MRVLLQFAIIGCVAQALAQNFTPPPVGQLCPSGFTFDAANCFLGPAPSGSQPQIVGTSFVYTSGSGCLSGFTANGSQCVRQVPAGYAPFVFNNSFYVKPNLHFVQQLDPTCPPGSNFDLANCFFGKAPSGTTASIGGNEFLFSKGFFQSCTTLRPGSVTVSLTRCSIGPVPFGWAPFIFSNGWYVQPIRVFNGNWLVSDYMADPPQYQRSPCLGNVPTRNWQLTWSDEFNDAPDNQKCYTSDDHLRCILRPDWSIAGSCDGAPVDWRVSASWTADQVAHFSGIRNLDKCRWSVYDSFNAWDVWVSPRPSMGERTNSYRPENVQVQNGLLTVRTREHPALHPGDGYCCGMQIEPDPANHGELFTKECPYSGGLLTTGTGLPWTQTNNPSDNDPDKRYVGFGVSPGRIEFRARMTKLGHGGWMSLWLFADQVTQQPAGELDAVEFLADTVPTQSEPVVVQGIPEQIRVKSSTYGMAWQTAHDWYPSGSGHVGHGIGIPIGLGEWHIYAIEWESAEVRFFIDGCLSHRLVEGQQVTDRWSGVTQTFHVPQNQTMAIIIGTPATAAAHLPAWYRAYLKKADACGNGLTNCANADSFEPSEMEVDYVRVYSDPNAHKTTPPQPMNPVPPIPRPHSDHQPPSSSD